MQPNNKIFITRDWHEEAVNYLCDKKYEVITWKNITSPTESEIINILKDCVAIISEFDDKITNNIINKAPNLKVISNRAVGYENIDILKEMFSTKGGIFSWLGILFAADGMSEKYDVE